MQTKFRNLKNDLEELEGHDQVNRNSDLASSNNTSKLANNVLLVAFLVTLIFYAGTQIQLPSISNPINTVGNFVQNLNQPSEELLTGMGSWMEEMGYGQLSHEELIELRRQGVTATFTSQMRDLGYTDLTLQQLVDLRQADVSSTFASMMKELGYILSVDELIQLRRSGVTAHFTSNMMDIGYTIEELTQENLMRMRNIGVSHTLARRLMEERGQRQSVEELIRYRISNQ